MNLSKRFIHVQEPYYNMVIYIEVMSTGLGHDIIINHGATSIGLGHSINIDIGTLCTGLGHIVLSDIAHVQTKHHVQ